ncbi:MAG: methyltransferase domain-containing protein [Anaerolineales bacterium]
MPGPMRLIQIILRPIFYLLYHQFAWAYDLVAAIVSLGRWQEWVHTAIPYISGRVLEIGFGPGHLQTSLNEKIIPTFGLDESPQMGRQAARRIKKAGAIARLTRGYAQSIPFAGEAFDSVVATFPAEYIYDQQTLKEIRRVLLPGGQLVIIPTAWITGGHLLERLAAWVFRLSGEAPGKPHPLSVVLKTRFVHTGFEVHNEIVEKRGSQVLVILAKKT